MKNKNTIAIIGINLVLATIIIFFVKNLAEKSAPQKEEASQSIRVIKVDRLISAPEKYKGFLGVEGKVIKIDESKGLFLLGCEDACIFIPVKYKGQIPGVGTEIAVYGEIKKQEDGKYFFEAKEVKVK